MTFNPPTTSLYRCTVDGHWNPPVAPKCVMDSLCEQPPSPMNGGVECQGNAEIMLCRAACDPGYTFEDGFEELSIQCVRRTGVWSPTVGFPDCERKRKIYSSNTLTNIGVPTVGFPDCEHMKNIYSSNTLTNTGLPTVSFPDYEHKRNIYSSDTLTNI
ncbi:hypothetical protein AVEN_212528-1 [Araneus ventricosus]|uniref:Sushi domain-containing protein n=2 Tax=Araneus ventricosus TaxID=182803 RepID=A0A4Y2UZA3_ARAVE|nr:hypothetical protein AVEN_212528-1 [Araneus ventricosus]